MIRPSRVLGFALSAFVLAAAANSSMQPRIRVMILTGQSNQYHNWPVSSAAIKHMLDGAGVFDAIVVTSPAKGEDMSGFTPDFSRYAAVVMDYEGDEWPDATKQAFVQYVRNGGGLVLVHAADNAFPKWREFLEMSGVGGWGGRDETWGPKVRWRDGKMVLDSTPGTATHPPRHDFTVVTRAPDHPITRGLPAEWMQPNDEIYSQLRGPAKNLEVLATALADKARGGTGEHEPMLMTIQYGKGRVFHNTLGHVGPKDTPPYASISSEGYITSIQRGTEWVATGKVTLTQGREQKAEVRREFAGLLDFEADHTEGGPKGWNGFPAGTFAVDDRIVHGGRWSLRIDRKPDSPQAFTAVSKSIPLDFKGARLELRGFLRTEDVSDFAGLWLRQDADGAAVAFDNMQARQLKGTTPWTEHSIVLPLQGQAKQLTFGVLAAGTGRVWADDLQLLVDGKPVADAPRVEAPKTVLDHDREFDAGSGIDLTELTQAQIANLALLGKTWGFLKYHHPAVRAGTRQWDFDLFRILPVVLNAADAPSARTALHKWITGLGEVPACKSCASLAENDLHLKPPVSWLNDDALGPELASTLRAVYRSRPADGRHFYVSAAPNVGNPIFDRELSYQNLSFPDAGYRLLALYRFWNIIEYWFPYRDLLDGPWDDELRTFIPRVMLAKDADSYKREMMALIARAQDTHANLWSSLDVRPPVGKCVLPVTLRFVEKQAVVTGYAHAEAGPATGFEIGDVVSALDGARVTDLVERWRPYYAASNEPARLRDIARSMTRGECGPVRVTVNRGSKPLSLTPVRVPDSSLIQSAGRTHDRPGDTFQKLSPQVAYLKLSSVDLSQIGKYLEAAAGTAGLVIDIRNYPSAFVVFALGSRLVDRPTAFARFTTADLVNPGAFGWTPPLSLQPAARRYDGKVAIVVDEVSQSQSEYTTMAFRASPNAIVVGSTTAGADGNVSPVPLPGGLRAMISGIGVFYPDKTPTQRVGIIPDVEAKPTIEGIRAGRDEVLEAALRHILGPATSPADIERLARWPR